MIPNVSPGRKSVHSRPRIPSKQDLLDYTFAVPDSPQITARRKDFRLNNSPSREDNDGLNCDDILSTPRSNVPFPDSFDPSTRHNVCNDSLRPWTYLLTFPGKNVRDLLIAAFNTWIGCDTKQLVLIKQIVGYLHSASLLIDDIEDESATRRGFPSAHIKFGIAPTINAGNYVYFLAMEKLLLLQSPSAIQIFTSEMLNLHRGQGRDIFWRTTSTVVSEEEYLQMIRDKTGGLFRLAVRTMIAVASHADEKFVDHDLRPLDSKQKLEILHLCNDLAEYFQIRDDLLNLASPEYHKKKGFCEDITEGKFSFIVLYSLRKLQGTNQAQELVKILKLQTKDRGVIIRALVIMQSTGAFEYCLNFLDKLVARIYSRINEFGGNHELLSIVKSLEKDMADCRDIKNVIDSS